MKPKPSEQQNAPKALELIAQASGLGRALEAREDSGVLDSRTFGPVWFSRPLQGFAQGFPLWRHRRSAAGPPRSAAFACALGVIIPFLLFIFEVAAQDVSRLTTLAPGQAADLASKRKGALALNALAELTPEAATAFAAQQGELSLNGLTTLSPAAATALARHAPSTHFGYADLSLDGLARISPDTAAALATHQGALTLKGLTQLDSIPLAKKLAAQWGELQLNGLTTLSPEIAAILATNEGVLVDRTRPGVEQRRSDRAASVLRFDSLTELQPATAAALAKQKGVLVFNGLSRLSPAVAAQLASHEGTLVLSGLTELSPETAAALAASPSELVLNGLTELAPGSAAVLAKHTTRVYLTGLAALDTKTREAVRRNSNLRLPSGMK